MKTTILRLFIFLIAFGARDTHAQIPNSDFENWTFPGPMLTDWQTNSCPMCLYPANMIIGDTYIVRQDSVEVYHGTYSAGFVYNGLYPALATTRFALSAHPLSLKAYVKNELYGQNDDTAFIGIQFFKNNTVVDSGEWINTASINNYTLLTIPVSQNATSIDSAEITISFGNNQYGLYLDEPIFWVDYLSLDFPTGIDGLTDNEKDLSVFPNPSGKVITISPPGKENIAELKILDALGQVMLYLRNNRGITTLDVSQFEEGIYFIRAITEQQHTYMKQLIIQK